MGVTLERVRVSFNQEMFTVPIQGSTDKLHGIDLKIAIEAHMGVPVVNQKLRSNEIDVSDAIQLSKTSLQNDGVVELEYVDVGAAPPEGGSTKAAPQTANTHNGFPNASVYLSTYTVTSTPIRRGNAALVGADVLVDISTRMVDALPRSEGTNNVSPPPPLPPVAPQHAQEACTKSKSKPIPPPAPTQDLTVVNSLVENAEQYRIIDDCSIELAQLNPYHSMNNKFYVIQVLERQDVDGEFYCFTHWGRAGEAGAFKMDRFPSFVGALHALQKKFKDKTGNEWDERRQFKHVEGKYVMTRSPAEGSDADSNDNQDTVTTTKRTENTNDGESGGSHMVSIWPTCSSGAVLLATNGAGGTTHEVICIRPTVVRGDPLCYRNVGSVTADGLSAALTTKAGAEGSTLLDSLAAEVHLSMVRLFTRRLGITDVEPAQLHQRVVDAMRSSSTVDVSCADGGSWSLEWQFTSVGCSLIARVAQEKAAVEVPKPSSAQEHVEPPEVPDFGSRGGRGMGRGGDPDDWESEFGGYLGGRGGRGGRGGGGPVDWDQDEWLPRGGGRGRGGFRGGYFDADDSEYVDYSRGRGGRGGRGRGGDYFDRPARGRGMRGRGRAGDDRGSY